MKDSTTKGFIQGYDAQAAVEAPSQIILAAEVTIAANDKQQLEPMIAEIEKNCNTVPEELSANASCYSEENVGHAQGKGIRPFILPGNRRHTDAKPAPLRGKIPKHFSLKERMERLLRSMEGRKAYAKRKETVEPVFGQIKDVRGFRQFLLRGLDNVRGEWQIICPTHNLLKLYRWGYLRQRHEATERTPFARLRERQGGDFNQESDFCDIADWNRSFTQ